MSAEMEMPMPGSAQPAAELRGLLGHARHTAHEVVTMPRDLIVLRLTLLLLMLHGSQQGWKLDVPLRVLCGAMLVHSPLLTSRALWLVVTCTVVVMNAMHWFHIDNHKYLMTYWCVGCTLAVASGSRDAVLRQNARMLVGICFALAVIWKLAAGQFVDGSFLHWTFLEDGRVESTSMLVGNLSADQLAENRSLISLLKSSPGDGVGVTLSTSDGLRWVTLAMSWWTLLIETAVAVTFLAPRHSRIAKLRDWTLIIFVATTYGLLPVIGFAFTLCILGFMQCEPERRRTGLAYLGLLVAIQLTRIPWDNIVGSMMS